MIKSIQGMKNNLIESIVVLAACLLFPIFQLIAYKCIQKEDEDIWRKWIEFFSYLRLILVAVLVVCAQLLSSTAPYYFIYGIYVLYTIIYAWKNKFVFPVGGRIVFVLGELCAMTISFFFIFQISLMKDYYLDLFFISGILLLDICYYIAMTVYLVKYGMPKDGGSEKVHPGSDESQDENLKKNKSLEMEEMERYDRRKKYRDSSYDELDQSNENLNRSKVARRRR